VPSVRSCSRNPQILLSVGDDRSQLRLHFPPALRNFGSIPVTYIAHREPCTDVSPCRWMLPPSTAPLSPPPCFALRSTFLATLCLHAHKNQRDLVVYLHQAAWTPTVATWLTPSTPSFPILAGPHCQTVRKYLPPSLATAMHLHRTARTSDLPNNPQLTRPDVALAISSSTVQPTTRHLSPR
jgi:hypothetical protein